MKPSFQKLCLAALLAARALVHPFTAATTTTTDSLLKVIWIWLVLDLDLIG